MKNEIITFDKTKDLTKHKKFTESYQALKLISESDNVNFDFFTKVSILGKRIRGTPGIKRKMEFRIICFEIHFYNGVLEKHSNQILYQNNMF